MLIDFDDVEWECLYEIFYVMTFKSPDSDLPIHKGILRKIVEAKIEEESEKITEQMMVVRFYLQRTLWQLLDNGYLDETFKNPEKQEQFIKNFILKYCIEDGKWNQDCQ
jgi:hypothetical protein